jgi:uncharacterized protein (TIGR02646 family)
MRSIHQHVAPDFFLAEIEQTDFDRSDFDNLHCKPKLREHISAEQANLCIYCEAGLDKNQSHLEHIEPQQQNPQARFDYDNLVVSCNGGKASCSEFKGLDIRSCGHHKGKVFDVELFLNPITEQNIAAYFDYDTHSTKIIATQLAPKQSNYMVEQLNLNSAYLLASRYQARLAFVAVLMKQTPEIRQKMLKQTRPFMSFLQACYVI